MRDNEIVGLWEAYLQVHQPKEEVEQLDEFLGSDAQKYVDKATKGVQSGLEKLGLPINRTPKGTTTQKQQQEKIKPVGEEVENWVNSLIDEGYDLSEYTWEDMYEMYVNLDEAGLPYGPVGKGFKKLPPGKKRTAMMKRAADLRKQAMEDDGDGGKGSPRGKMGEINAALTNPRLREETDLFDAILEHLVAEGYADTNESALVIMANMSEEWREDILAEAITSEKGRAKAAAMIAARTTPSGRAKKGEGANVAAIKKIIVSDKEGLGGTPMTPTMARNPVKKKNYFGFGNRAASRAERIAARRAGT